jgi:Phosphoenolpyruvate phosphomutase
MATITDKRRAYRELHIGSARYLQHLGFKALATTSAGFAFSRGLPDNAVPREVMLAPQTHRGADLNDIEGEGPVQAALTRGAPKRSASRRNF